MKLNTLNLGMPLAWLPPKFMLIMKLIIILMTVCLMQASASSFAQKITINKRNASLASVLREIKNQSGMRVIYADYLMERARPVSINVLGVSVEAALQNIMAGQDLNYSIEEKTIVIKAKEFFFLDKVISVFTDIEVRGKVTDDKGLALPGASVRVKGTDKVTSTNDLGEFVLQKVEEKSTIVISYVGFETKEVIAAANLGTITLNLSLGKLDEVSVVSTGYQSIPKERATGSFVQIDNELLNRRISTDVITRLEDIVPGLIFQRGKTGGSPTNHITIRGRSTVHSNSQVLIILDNFPYEDDISNINPNDIQSITILKDAAAASIWGARAGNGVIVITTKSGKYNNKMQVSVNSNLTLGDKPNQFYQPMISTSEFIELEKTLFSEKVYNRAETSPYHYAITPVIELLIAKRDGLLSAADADAKIESLKKYDVRNDYNEYLNRKSSNQQYSLNLNGGTDNQRYFVSAGYDKNLQNLVGNDYDRFTLNANNSFSFLKNKLELTTGILFSATNTQANNSGNPQYTNPLTSFQTIQFPYARLADDNGNPLAILHDWREGFMQSAEDNGLLDWKYNPLDEIRFADNITKVTNYRFNTNLKYNVMSGLSANVLYQYGRNLSENKNHLSQQTYYTRNLINLFSQVDAITKEVTRNIPDGGILLYNYNNVSTQNLRAQLNFDKTWVNKHQLNIIAGSEIRDQQTDGSSYTTYGYDDEHATSKLVSYTSDYTWYLDPRLTGKRIPNSDSQLGLTDRFISYYSNGSYTYDRRYIISASARIDKSNLFGVKTNQKGVPLYSAGVAWVASEESFYGISGWLPYLKVRATYGSSGNVNKSLSAFTTSASFGNFYNTGLPYAYIINPPNPSLRWERVKTINVGLDFETTNHRIQGTIDYYSKRGLDLIGGSAYPGQTGIKNFTANNANTAGHGVDLNINTLNLNGQFKWSTNFLFSYGIEKVTKYNAKGNGLIILGSADGTSISPLEGRPLFSVYSLPFAGLDRTTGDPQGYLDGKISNDWVSILNGVTPETIHYNGSARPTKYGALRNTISWKQFSISANISYRLGYFFRRNSVDYNNVFNGVWAHDDYNKRWQKPGDELTTTVPSLVLSRNLARQDFYSLSSALVEKGDHIRLQDLTFGYDLLQNQLPKLPFKAIRLYIYANNLGILWKSYKGSEDPDYAISNFPPVRTIAFGLKTDF